MFDSVRLHAELTHIQHALSNVAVSARGKALVDELQAAVGGTTAALLWQALYADCMRVAYAAVAADGVIGAEEIGALYPMLSAAARYYAAVAPAVYGEFVAIDRRSARAFLDRYAADRGPFGRGGSVLWPGLALCRHGAEIGDGTALERYERTMDWLITDVCRIGGVTEGDPRWHGRVEELDALRRTLARDAAIATPVTDLRVHAFLAPSGIFTAVQQASSIFQNDPFDVESIHGHARESFEQMVEQARTPSQITTHGQMLLVLGDSGCGKTHLLRGFRRHVQEYGRGFVVYAQLQSRTEDYERYLLQHLVDSLARPYSGPHGERTGLRELANGLLRLVSPSLQARVQRLADDTWEGKGVTEYVDDLVDDLLREGNLASFDPDLLRVMLYALRPDPRTAASVYKYLRCEDMNPRDRRWIGEVVPRTGDDHPHRMILDIGRLASLTQRALVVMIDQVDLTGFEASSGKLFRRAIDALYRITSELRSAVAVIACLSDLYSAVRDELSRPAIDRLEKNPAVARLKVNRSYAEIEEVVARRLAWLFAEHRTIHRPETPVYPIPERLLRELENRRMRDVLEWCHEFQARCATAGTILESDETVIVEPRQVQPDLDQIAAAWNDAMHAQGISVPTEDDEILTALNVAARTCAEEAGLALTGCATESGALRVKLSSSSQAADLTIMITNKNYHRGAFAGQIEALRKRGVTTTAVAIRTEVFPRGESSERVISQLVKDGGRPAHVDESTLRALAAFQHFAPSFPADRVSAWRRRDRPISSLPVVAAIFDLERLRGERPAATAGAGALSGPEGADVPPSVVKPDDAPASIASVKDPAPDALGTASGLAPQEETGAAPPRGSGGRRGGRPGSRATTVRPAEPEIKPAAAPVTEIATPAPDPAPAPEPRVPARAETASTLEAKTAAQADVVPPSEPKIARQKQPRAASSSEAVAAPAASPTVPATKPPGPRPPKRTPRAVPVTPAATDPEPLPGPPRSFPSEGPAPSAGTLPPGSPGMHPPARLSTQLRIGVSTGFQSEPRTLEIGSLVRHTGILGSAGTGKSTLALNLIEQALERDTAVILLDRKGDLSGYARPDWWQHTADPERARRLADRLDVRLFTPGLSGGRPLSLPVVPDLAHVPEHERDRVVQCAAVALAAMMRFGEGTADTARLAILTQAIAVLAGRGTSNGLAELIALIDRQDDALVARAARAGRYDDGLFKRLVHDLQAMQLSDASLFDPAAEPLTVETLIGRPGDGKVPLAIASTRFLGDVPRIQAWVSLLVGCLSRHLAMLPGNELHTVLVIDEAELFLPLAAKAPSKEPLQDLLKRAQTAGLGVVLASHSPAEFDYRSRELVHTWFLGRIPDARTNDKLNPLFERLPPIRGKLAVLERGRFVMLQDGSVQDVERTPSLLRTDPVPDTELIALAARANPRLTAHGTQAPPQRDEPGRAGAAGVPAAWVQ